MDISQFVHQTIDEHLGYFQLCAIINKAAMNICAQAFVWNLYFIYVGQVLKSRMAGLHGRSTFNFLRNY